MKEPLTSLCSLVLHLFTKSLDHKRAPHYHEMCMKFNPFIFNAPYGFLMFLGVSESVDWEQMR